MPLPNVSAKILSKVLEYCKYHVAAKNKTEDDKPAKTDEEVNAWDKEFVKVDQATLFELILVRHCLLSVIPVSPDCCSAQGTRICDILSIKTGSSTVQAYQYQQLSLKCFIVASRRPTTSTSRLCWIWAASQ